MHLGEMAKKLPEPPFFKCKNQLRRRSRKGLNRYTKSPKQPHILHPFFRRGSIPRIEIWQKKAL
jgi:hypothetical protein